jgi:hypothetical protein
LARFAWFARLERGKPDFSRVRRGPNFGDETPGFWNVAMSQVLIVQALAKFARSKTGRVLVETCGDRVPKSRSAFSVIKEHA